MWGTIIVALIGVLGSLVLETMRRNNKDKVEILGEMRRLKTQVKELSHEVTLWQEKYFLLLRDLTKHD